MSRSTFSRNFSRSLLASSGSYFAGQRSSCLLSLTSTRTAASRSFGSPPASCCPATAPRSTGSWAAASSATPGRRCCGSAVRVPRPFILALYYLSPNMPLGTRVLFGRGLNVAGTPSLSQRNSLLTADRSSSSLPSRKCREWPSKNWAAASCSPTTCWVISERCRKRSIREGGVLHGFADKRARDKPASTGAAPRPAPPTTAARPDAVLPGRRRQAHSVRGRARQRLRRCGVWGEQGVRGDSG